MGKEKIRIEKRDNVASIMRALLLLSIVSAHSSITFNETTGVFSQNIWKIWQIWSIIGVPGFFGLSGYFFKGSQESFQTMLWKKSRGICLPWIVCGTVTYFISLYPSYNLKRYGEFIIGYNSYLYYLTILIICYLLFYKHCRSTLFLVMCIALNLGSLALTQAGVTIPGITNFLNPFNWIGYFAIGCLLKKYEILDYIKHRKSIQVCLSFLLIVTILVGYFLNIKSYFYVFSFIVGSSAIVGIYSIACFLVFGKNDMLGQLGNYSFTIYLLHMPIVAILKKAVRLIDVNFYIAIPVITIGIFFFALTIFNKLTRNTRISSIQEVIGMR